MSQMKAAFTKAGYRYSMEEWPSEDLLQVAVRAMAKHADDMDATQHAIMRACRSDATLLRQLLLPWWRQATASIITEARRQIQQRQRHEALKTAVERKAANVVALIERRELAAEKKEREEELARIAEQDRWNREELNKWLRTKARELEIDGRPWWQATPARARQWQRKQAHDARFIDLVLEGVPDDDKRPISHYRRADEVNALWDKAFEGAARHAPAPSQ